MDDMVNVVKRDKLPVVREVSPGDVMCNIVTIINTTLYI